jgi:hydroxymethylpyrimidine/phosphomethylpyrimidine kinase
MADAGRKLMTDEAIGKAVRELLPQAQWVTPNRWECELILGRKMNTPQEYADGAKALADKLQTNVLLKSGGDEKCRQATDYVCYKGKLFTLSSPKVKLPACASHGTGCTLSAAMTALTALAFSWSDMLQDAKAFLFGSLRENVEIGKGVFSMYPPVEDALELIEMAEYASAGGKKKGVR